MNIVDTHAHLDMSPFDPDREDVIKRAGEAGVVKIVTVGIDLPSSSQAIQLAERNPGVLAAVGIHPQESKDIQKQDITRLAELCKHERVVGVGETGLDFYHNSSPREDQFRVFEWQLELSQSTGLPVIIHSRQALEDTLSVLRNWTCSLQTAKPLGVIHCFSGDLMTALEYLEMGFYVSIGGYIGYPSSAQLRETVKDIPTDRLVLETDCPFLPPQKYRGKRNEPAYTAITLGIISKIKGLSPEEMASITTSNADRIFNISNLR